MISPISAMGAAVTAVLISTAPPSDSTSQVPYINLSASSPLAVHHADGSWTVPIPGLAPADTGFCRGTYINPEIVARGRGTAVHYAAKFFCTQPVEYSITTGVTNLYDEKPIGPVISHAGGQITRGGLSPTPYVEGFTPCRNNMNSGWLPYDDSTIHGEKHSGVGKLVTVGCRV